MEIGDFIPKWTQAVKAADKDGVSCTVPEFIDPDFIEDARIIYFKEKFDLNFQKVLKGVVTEAHRWNTTYFRRDAKEFCEFCNTMEKAPAYKAITQGGENFDEFKKKLWEHVKENHKEIVFYFDEFIDA